MGRLLIVAFLALVGAVLSLQASGDEVKAFGQSFQRNHLLSGEGDEDAWKSVNSRILWGGKQEIFNEWPNASEQNGLYLTLFGTSAAALAEHAADYEHRYHDTVVLCTSPPVKGTPQPAPPTPPLLATPPAKTVTPLPGIPVKPPVAVVNLTPPPPPSVPPAAPATPAAPPATTTPPPPVSENTLERCHLKVTRLRVQLENALPDLTKGVGGDERTPPKYFEAKPFTHEFKSFVLTFQGPAAEQFFNIYLARAWTTTHGTGGPVIKELNTRIGALGSWPLVCEMLKLQSKPVVYTCRMTQDTFKLRRSVKDL
jgi:hypothetical protein